MSKISDLMVVLKGLRLVSRTAFGVKTANAQGLWRYSSAKESLDDVFRSAKSKDDDKLKDKRKTTKTKTNSKALERASMISEGIRQFVRFRYFGDQVSRAVTVASVPSTSADHADDPATVDSTPAVQVVIRSDTQVVAPPSASTASSKIADQPQVQTPSPKPKLSEKSKERRVPASRLGRLASYGSLAAGLGLGALAEATRRTLTPWSSSGSKNDGTGLNDSLFLTEANAERIVNTLCRVRGAALKLGQMLSLQDESLISPQLMKILERVRQSADFMPLWQAERVLEQQLGHDWRSKVGSFEPLPFAAASIGQVHLAKLHDGRDVAVKIQYPGVAAGIESDIRNLMTTLKVWNILPAGLFIDNLIAVASRELGHEVDYIHEAKCARRFRDLLRPHPVFNVPEVIDSLSTDQVFTTELVDGLSLDKCGDMSQEVRNQIATELFRLTLMELFDFRFMQTDPNWSNFLYDPATQRIALLDFGASREYSKQFVDQYGKIIKASVEGDRNAVLDHSRTIGFLTGYETKMMENAHIDATIIMGETFRDTGPYDFSVQDITRRIRDFVPVLLDHRLTPPPEEIYSLHRKLSGIFLLSAKLKAKVNCGRLFRETYERYTLRTE